jgi:hypothetical protein
MMNVGSKRAYFNLDSVDHQDRTVWDSGQLSPLEIRIAAAVKPKNLFGDSSNGVR